MQMNLFARPLTSSPVTPPHAASPGVRTNARVVNWYARAVLAVVLLFSTSFASAQVACSPPAAGVPNAVTNCGNPEFQSCSIDVGGIPRHFCLHAPALPPTDVPLVLGFHGSGGMASRAVNWLDSHTEQGMILVAPTALPSSASCNRHWRTLSGTIGPNAIPDWAAFQLPDTCMNAVGAWPAGSPNGADLEFIRQLIIALENQYDIDQRFAFGFSSGAGMVMQLMITEPFASSIDGFAMVANGINQAKADAVVNGGSIGPFSAVGPDARSPSMLIWGTADKVQLPASRLAAAADLLSAAGAPNCVAPLDTPAKTFACLMNNPVEAGAGRHTLVSRIEETQDWLVEFNNAEPRAIEGLYPDLGHGQVSGDEDDTMTVRRDYPAGSDGDAVAVLTIIDGRHVFPGATGNEPPCSSSSCDIDAMQEILQFWRANYLSRCVYGSV